jgi:hypothetical protein
VVKKWKIDDGSGGDMLEEWDIIAGQIRHFSKFSLLLRISEQLRRSRDSTPTLEAIRTVGNRNNYSTRMYVVDDVTNQCS